MPERYMLLISLYQLYTLLRSNTVLVALMVSSGPIKGHVIGAYMVGISQYWHRLPTLEQATRWPGTQCE